MKIIITVFLFFQCFTISSYGQDNKILDVGINKFRFMEGIWKGSGWVLNGDANNFLKKQKGLKQN